MMALFDSGVPVSQGAKNKGTKWNTAIDNDITCIWCLHFLSLTMLSHYLGLMKWSCSLNNRQITVRETLSFSSYKHRNQSSWRDSTEALRQDWRLFARYDTFPSDEEEASKPLTWLIFVCDAAVWGTSSSPDLIWISPEVSSLAFKIKAYKLQ